MAGVAKVPGGYVVLSVRDETTSRAEYLKNLLLAVRICGQRRHSPRRGSKGETTARVEAGGGGGVGEGGGGVCVCVCAVRVSVSGSARQSVVLSSAMFGSQSTLPWSSDTLLKCDFSETVTTLP